MKGTTEKTGDKFLISFPNYEKKIADKITHKFTVDSKTIQLHKESAINEIFLSLPENQVKENSNFQLCLTTS